MSGPVLVAGLGTAWDWAWPAHEPEISADHAPTLCEPKLAVHTKVSTASLCFKLGQEN